MKIALLTNEYPPHEHGGIGTFTKTYRDALVTAGHEVHVFALYRANKHSAPAADENVHWIGVNFTSRLKSIASRFSIRKRIKREHAKHHFDVLEAPEYMGLFFWKIRSLPLVLRLHLSNSVIKTQLGKPKDAIPHLFESIALKQADLWIAVSEHVLELTRKEFGQTGNAKVVYNATPSIPVVPKIEMPNGPFVLYAGTLSERKGAYELAAAIPFALERNPDLYFVFAGRPEKVGGRTVRDEIFEGLPAAHRERVKFTGPIDRTQVLAYMAQAKCLVAMTKLEAFGLVLLESMASGCPVIAPKIPPMTEIIEDGVNGFFAPFSAPSQLSEIISKVVSDEDLREKIAANAVSILESKFSMQLLINKSLVAYASALNRKK